MIPCLGCERARDLLGAYADDELLLDERVAVEAHLRVCAVCAARVEDLQIIASSLRVGALARPTAADERALAGLQAGTLIRVSTERDQAILARMREAFADMRLLWPALGAIGAVAICAALASGLLYRTGSERAESLAAMIHTLAQGGVLNPDRRSPPGSVGNPLSLDETMFSPQVIAEDAVSFVSLVDDEAVFAVTALVGSNGLIANYELLGTGRGGPAAHPEDRQADIDAVHDAVSRIRFAPALAADGRGVAVEILWVMAKTTATAAGPRPLQAAVPMPPPPVAVPAPVPSIDTNDDGVPDAVEEPILRDYDSGLSRVRWLPWT